jgi:phosphoribosylformylglycinamidine (FGAM) synthase-like enzyme
VASKILANDVIDEVRIGDEAVHFVLPGSVSVRDAGAVPLCKASDAELERISKDGHLSLTLVEMRAIRDHYVTAGREPTVAELETLAQTWSEHCKHKTFAGIIDYDGERIDNLLKTTIKAATLELAKPWCVSVFHDNAGVIEFDEGWHVCFKVETHNHPSAIDPYGGAGTGIGGVIRDILGVGLGAKPIANTDAFFVGPLDLAEKDLPKGCMHPRRILRGVVAGVRDYGNRMGIPTVNGGVWVDPRYVGNPLVFAAPSA